MATDVAGTFKIDKRDENAILEAGGGSKGTRANVSRSFEGGLEGEGTVEWLMSFDAEGSAVFVGLERIVGGFGDETGTFVLKHVGTFDGQTARAELTIVLGSG